MESINTGVVKGKMPEIVRKGKITTGTEPEIVPGEHFIKAVDTDFFKSTIKREGVFESANFLMALTCPFVQSGVAASTPGITLFGSITGEIAKRLINTEMEIRLGQMISEQVESQISLYHNPALNSRVNSIGQKLAANSSRKDIKYTFKVLDDNTVNAFACPGGMIYVHRGLLERFTDDKELAFILGHEVGHVEHRDSIDKLGTAFAIKLLQVALGTTPGKLDDMVGAAAGMLYDNALSQKAEYSADQRGAEHLIMLGINPKEGAEALRRLKKEEERDPNLLERLLSTHPPIDQRASRLEVFAKSKGY